MSNEVQRRWGIVALAVAMFFVTMINAGINGNKTSFYYWVWAMVGWYGYKGNLEQIRNLMKFLIWLNLGVVVLVMMFFEEQTVGYVTRGGDKQSMILGVLVMLIPKVFVYMYCDKQIKEAEPNKTEEVLYEKPSIVKKQNHVNPYLQSMSEEGRKKFENHNGATPKRVESMEDAYQRLSPKIEVKPEIKPTKTIAQIELDIDEDLCWEKAFAEYDSDKRSKGLWARLYAENNANEEKIKIEYLKIRANQLIEDAKNQKRILNEEIAKRKQLEILEKEKSTNLSDGEKDLLYAIVNGNFSTASNLLQSGASPFITKNGKSLVEIAIENEDKHMADMLKNYINKHS